ncbi:ECF transporter S component [Lentilactobacillus sp. Marseille-Q4993]|uniref:ECF transporter S component n=1 Tax=Lentilactobacillus sp. Marseille-Q4993 TaxID=3039492 RepID=UPI0024BD23EF|nr:ECF transporter S component [Lentilactobacillus sp. Marseille-Q4993]
MGNTANNIKIKRIVLAALLLATCVVGANIKIAGSIALDSAAAFIGAIVLGPVDGAVLGFFGHMISALLSGFPLTLPVHLIIAVMMAVCMFIFALIRQKLGKRKMGAVIFSDIVGYLINVPLELLLLYPILKQGVYAFFIPLTLATVVNLVICEVIYIVFADRLSKLVGED